MKDDKLDFSEKQAMKVNDSKVSGHLDSLFTRKEAVFTGFGCLILFIGIIFTVNKLEIKFNNGTEPVATEVTRNNLESYKQLDDLLTKAQAMPESEQRTDFIEHIHTSLSDNDLTVEEYSGAFELFDMLDEQVVLDRLKGEG